MDELVCEETVVQTNTYRLPLDESVLISINTLCSTSFELGELKEQIRSNKEVAAAAMDLLLQHPNSSRVNQIQNIKSYIQDSKEES